MDFTIQRIGNIQPVRGFSLSGQRAVSVTVRTSGGCAIIVDAEKENARIDGRNEERILDIAESAVTENVVWQCRHFIEQINEVLR
jgi:hypothetical protein